MRAGIDQATIRTERGDDVVLTLSWLDDQPRVLMTIVDADDTPLPTAEPTLAEVGALRDTMRELCERGVRGRWRLR